MVNEVIESSSAAKRPPIAQITLVLDEKNKLEWDTAIPSTCYQNPQNWFKIGMVKLLNVIKGWYGHQGAKRIHSILSG